MVDFRTVKFVVERLVRGSKVSLLEDQFAIGLSKTLSQLKPVNISTFRPALVLKANRANRGGQCVNVIHLLLLIVWSGG